MNITRSLSDYKGSIKTVVTIGTFDGVHIGHQQVIKRLVYLAKRENKKSVLLTFFPHPRMVLQKTESIKLINTIDERVSLLEKMELDELIIHPFDKSFSEMTALDFVKNVLIEILNVSKLIIGYDHHFGKDRTGSLTELTKYGNSYGFDIEEITAQDVNSISVSSTKIRKALSSGDIATANCYLGYNFMLTGVVVKGRGLGKKMGFPTANIRVEKPYKIIPREGIYAVKSNFDNQTFFGMMNIGSRPTVSKGQDQTIEVHLFGFNKDIYGRKLTVELLYFIRQEQKFDSVEKLIEQLKKDKENVISHIKK